MLVADIAGGSFPAVINILLALRARDRSGQGCHLDIAMTDAMFTFAWYALALGTATGTFPKAGELPLVGASPRYQLYPTKDGKLVACGALEQKFWNAFCRAIGLAAGTGQRSRATRQRPLATVAQDHRYAQTATTGDRYSPPPIAASPSSRRWRRRCDDPHFVERGLFAHSS